MNSSEKEAMKLRFMNKVVWHFEAAVYRIKKSQVSYFSHM